MIKTKMYLSLDHKHWSYLSRIKRNLKKFDEKRGC